MYQNVQNLFLQVVNSEEYESSLSFVTNFYASDVDAHQLKTQLHVLAHLQSVPPYRMKLVDQHRLQIK